MFIAMSLAKVFLTSSIISHQNDGKTLQIDEVSILKTKYDTLNLTVDKVELHKALPHNTLLLRA